MKFLSLLALAAAALAAVTPVAPRDTADAPAVEAPKHDDKPDHDDGHKPVGWHPECKPGIYACTPDKKGWLVCNTGYKWVYGGGCGWGEKCEFNWQNGSPYCINQYW